MSPAAVRGRVPARKVDATLLRRWPLPQPTDGGGKEARGRVLVVGGERELVGAVRLAGEAALRAGAGKLQLAVAGAAAGAIAVAVPEARVIALPEAASGRLTGNGARLPELAPRTDALVLGPGLETGAATRRLAARLLPRLAAPVVLDAGAIDLGLLRTWRRLGNPPRAILTPHHGEMAALLDCDAADVAADPERLARDFAREWGLVVVLKGAVTWIASPDGRSFIHRGGSAGLGTSGSGDVLAGVVGGLCARGAAPEQAACWAVRAHARAGAALARRRGPLGFLAREIAGELPALLG
ncbi:MAG TPA: NAD(P)H-hydrate dehydratase [Luteimonas sp.]